MLVIKHKELLVGGRRSEYRLSLPFPVILSLDEMMECYSRRHRRDNPKKIISHPLQTLLRLPPLHFCAAKTQGREPAEQLSPPKSRDSLCTRSAALTNAIASRLSEAGRFLAISRQNRGGTCARSVPYAGGLALWRIASLELPHGRPAMEEGVKCALLRRGQNLGLGALSRADFWAEFARSVFRVQGS
jgi:hypothetical protein